MSFWADLRIAEFQEATGISPATGETLEAIEALQSLCFNTIRILELERSGIRDGNGKWLGSDVVLGTCEDLKAAAELVSRGELRDAKDIEERAFRGLMDLRQRGIDLGLIPHDMDPVEMAGFSVDGALTG